MERKLMKIIFIILCIITTINIIIYHKFNPSEAYNDTFYIIDCVLCMVLGSLMLWDIKFSPENQKWGYKFFVIVVLVRGVVNLILKLIYDI